MANIRVRNGETVTTETTVALGDRLVIEAGGVIARTGAVPAIRVTGREAFILNEGSITVSSSGAAVTGALSGVLDVRLVNDGLIKGPSGAVSFSSSSGTTGAFRLDNSGTIDGGASQAIALRDLRASTITINNAQGGVITNAGTADVLRPGHDLATTIRIDNAGTILAGTVSGASSSGDGIDFQPQKGGVLAYVINRSTGHIEGGKHGVTGANEARIVNEAGGEIIGRNGSGINYDTEASDNDGAVVVINHGLISGRYDGFGDGDGDGVDVDYLVTVQNYGRIEGAGADKIDDFADGIAAGGGTILNAAGGEIFGETNGILIDDGDRNGAYAATRITNEGTITGELGYGIRLIGDFDDTLVNRGTIEAKNEGGIAVDMGNGADRLVNSGTIQGPIDLGGGNDSYAGANALVAAHVDGGAGDDLIVGSAANDVIVGGAGLDRMAGGLGNDTFTFADVLDTGATRGTADRITDFAAGDTIDLSAIDANTGASGDQAFTYVGQAAFSGVAGELSAVVQNGDVLVSGDVDGDGTADFAILLVGMTDPSVLAFSL